MGLAWRGGERRAAMGDWKIAYLNFPDTTTLKPRADMIDSIFSTDSDDRRYFLAKTLNIDYVFICRYEKEKYPLCDVKFTRDSKRFLKVYQNAEVIIFKLLKEI